MKPNEVKITVPSSLENLSLIRAMVKTYLELHQVSQRDVFQLLSVVDELSTNVVEHGYEYKPGDIILEIQKSNDIIRLVVEDNGVGFDVKELEKKEQKADKKHTHIGLVNTQQMLRTVYGEEATMEIQSEIDAGTCVTICLPLEKEVPLCGE